MSTNEIDIGSYGVSPPSTSCGFEDEGFGNELVSTHGVVVSRIENDDVYVREWSIDSHFEGADALEKFEQARHQYAFDFNFSPERRMAENDKLDGGDAALKQQLKKQLNKRQSP